MCGSYHSKTPHSASGESVLGVPASSVHVHSNDNFEQRNYREKMRESEDNYLIRYKISISMHDPREIVLNSAHIVSMESRRT